jgi:MFS family permease
MGAAPTAAFSRGRRRVEDRRRIFLGKTTRAVAYGALSGFLVLYLADDLHFSVSNSLILTAITLLGAAGANLVLLPPVERRFGRRGAVRWFAVLFVLSAALLFLVANWVVVVAAVLLGGVAASSNDNGPLASLDQAMIPSTRRRGDHAEDFARYNLIANFASAGGALLLVVPGALTPRAVPYLPAAPHPWIGLIYLVLAGMTLFAYSELSEEVEVRGGRPPSTDPAIAPERRGVVRTLSLLYGADAFAGGMVINPLIAAYFVLAWGQDTPTIGFVLFVLGVVSGLSFLVASRLARRFGLLRTMVFTHIPSNLLLIAVPFLPTFPLAFGTLVARSALSQMDVPTRQAYVMGIVPDRERTAVSAQLGGARSAGQSVGPFPAIALQSAGYLALPFVVAGMVNTGYDLVLWRRFRRVEGLPEDDDPQPLDDATTSSSASRRRG